MGVLWDDDPLAWERAEANAVRAYTDPPEPDRPTPAEAERDEKEQQA